MMLLPLSCASQNTKDKLVITFSDYDTAHLEELQELWRKYPPEFLDASGEEMQYSKIEMDKREKERTVLYVSFDKPLTSVDGVYGIQSFPETATSVTIPNSVTRLGDICRGCSSLTSVTIPNSVTIIGQGAFQGCSSLTSVTIPDSVTIIESYAFAGCSSLTSVIIPNSVTCIGGSEDSGWTAWNESLVFWGCSSLTSVTLPSSLAFIGGGTFAGCDSLTSINIPNSVTTIGNGAFADCTSLTSVTIPDSVEFIEDYAFAGCTSLNVTISNPNIFKKSKGGFSDCASVSVIIPDTVTTIEDATFDGCSFLTSVTIPDSVTSIGEDAFRGCSSLTSINIPGSVTLIGEDAFRGCNALSHVTLPDKCPPLEILSSGIIEEVSLKNVQWKCLRIEDNGCVFIIADDGTLVLAGFTNETTTAMANRFIESTEKYEKHKEDYLIYSHILYDPFVTVKEIVIPNDVSKIGQASFSYLGMTSVVVPDSVNSIGKFAFYGCELLTSVSLPQSLVNIGENAFPETTKIIRR